MLSDGSRHKRSEMTIQSSAQWRRKFGSNRLAARAKRSMNPCGILLSSRKCLPLKLSLVDGIRRTKNLGTEGLERSQQALGFPVVRELFFLRPKLGWMKAAAAPLMHDRVLDVEHLVIQKIFDQESRDARLVEQAAD